MVGLSDIPIVGKAVDMISEASVKAAYRGFRYMFCCKDLVNVLNSEIEKINIQENVVSKKVVDENESGKIVEDHVYKWQEQVKEIQEDSKKISEKYKNRRPIPNPLSRFRLGREAVQKANKVAQLMEAGRDLETNPIARLPPVENLPKTDSVFQDFASRKVAYDKIWQSLITEGSPLILGIYGLPGVGKTRIAEQLWKEAKEKGIFNKVTKAVVSGEKDLDVKRLQNELARDLNCHFESQDDIKHRASQLKHSIMYGDKVLVILDDVWREIPNLHDIGIPIGDDTTSKGGCKILFTSREKKVCLDNNCIDPVEITALTVVEAWDMFKDSVGTAKIEYLPDESLAKQVCNKCCGLPLLIRAVGKALRNMSGNVWKDALDQLQKYKIECIPGIDPEVYACLKLSFDNLIKDAKACLLLSSLYPEDAYISTSMLVELGIGSKLLPGGRSRVLSMVDTLESSSLIIVNEFTRTFKLHDIIRDVARSIAVKDYAFLFAGSDLSLPDHINGSPNLLCLDVKNNNNFNFPRDMIYNGLYTLWIESTSIGNHTFKVWEVAGTFVNLECLVLRNIEWAEQSPVQQLGKLRTLILDECDIQKTDFSFISEYLETLCVWECNLPVPLDLLNLKYLRKLEIFNWRKVVLVANTISSLSSTLEELHIPEGYRYQKKQDDEVNNSSISMELSRLTRLKSLKMEFPASERIQDPKLFSNLTEFGIFVGWGRYDFRSLTRWISLGGNKVEAAAFVSLIERAEAVGSLSTDVDVSSIFNSNRQAFSDLKILRIYNSDTMEHLARIQPHHHQIQPPTSFSQLTELYISRCSAMKYLFCNSVAKCLVQLQELSVWNCSVMEAIIVNEGSRTDGQEEEEDMIVNFSRLKRLILEGMPKLKGFNIDKKDMQLSTSTVAVAVSVKDNSAAIPTLSLFSRQVTFSALEKLDVSDLTVSDIWGKHYYNDNASSFCKLKSLKVWSCTNLETVIPLDMLHKLGNLEYLDIMDCSSVVSEIGTYGNTTAVHPLVALTDMRLHKLPSVINTWLNSIPDHSQAITVYPNLKKLHIKECNSLSHVFLPSIAGDLMHLEELRLDSCKMMTEIIGATAGDNISNRQAFSDLKILTIGGSDTMEHLARIQPHHQIQPSTSFSQLTDLYISDCSKMKYLFCTSVAKCLVQLQTLSVRNCTVMEAIIVNEGSRTDGQEEEDIIVNFSRLKSLTLRDMPKLKGFNIDKKDMQLSTSTAVAVSLKDNSAAIIPTLSLFSRQVAFLALEVLDVSDLTVSDIWGKHYYNDNASSFCELKSLNVWSCTKLKTVIPLDILHKLGNLKKLHIKECNSLSNVFLPSIARGLMHLEELHVDSCKMTTEIIGATTGDNISKQVFPCFSRLRWLKVTKSGRSTLFPFSVISSLQQLEEIEISDCAFLKDIVEEDVRGNGASSTDKKIIEFIQLKRVVLKNLPNLGSFMFGADYECHMPALSRVEIDSCGFTTLFPLSVISSLQQLKEIEISNCAFLKDIVEVDVRGNGASSTDKKIIEFIQLKKVILEDLPNLGRFMSGGDYECHMPALKEVKIDNCGFSTLFTCCRDLQQLRYLNASNCGLLEYVVKDTKNDEISEANDKIITLSQLWSIVLENLPNLKSFGHTSSYAFDMPKLSDFIMLRCPQVESFTYVKTSTGGLVYVISDWCREGEHVQDLNDYIKQNCKRGSNIISESAGESERV